MDMGVQTCIQDPAPSFYAYISRRGISELYGNSIFLSFQKTPYDGTELEARLGREGRR